MRLPSVKTITRIEWLDKIGDPDSIAHKVRHIMENMEPNRAMDELDRLLETFGVEYIHAGHNQKSPALFYLNTGDPYTTTVLLFRGKDFRIGSWGDIVEFGDYD